VSSDQAKLTRMTIVVQSMAISPRNLQSALAIVGELSLRGTYLTLEQSIEHINVSYEGWVGYFELTCYACQPKTI